MLSNMDILTLIVKKLIETLPKCHLQSCSGILLPKSGDFSVFDDIICCLGIVPGADDAQKS